MSTKAEALQSIITWIPVSDRLPEEMESGDRILIVLNERHVAGGALMPQIISLEATEDGWYSPDDMYRGYTPEDGEYWVKEKDILPAPPAGEEGEG